MRTLTLLVVLTLAASVAAPRNSFAGDGFGAPGAGEAAKCPKGHTLAADGTCPVCAAAEDDESGKEEQVLYRGIDLTGFTDAERETMRKIVDMLVTKRGYKPREAVKVARRIVKRAKATTAGMTATQLKDYRQIRATLFADVRGDRKLLEIMVKKGLLTAEERAEISAAMMAPKAEKKDKNGTPPTTTPSPGAGTSGSTAPNGSAGAGAPSATTGPTTTVPNNGLPQIQSAPGSPVYYRREIPSDDGRLINAVWIRTRGEGRQTYLIKDGKAAADVPKGLLVRAFLDANLDGVRQEDEPFAPGAPVTGISPENKIWHLNMGKSGGWQLPEEIAEGTYVFRNSNGEGQATVEYPKVHVANVPIAVYGMAFDGLKKAIDSVQTEATNAATAANNAKAAADGATVAANTAKEAALGAGTMAFSGIVTTLVVIILLLVTLRSIRKGQQAIAGQVRSAVDNAMTNAIDQLVIAIRDPQPAAPGEGDQADANPRVLRVNTERGAEH